MQVGLVRSIPALTKLRSATLFSFPNCAPESHEQLKHSFQHCNFLRKRGCGNNFKRTTRNWFLRTCASAAEEQIKVMEVEVKLKLLTENDYKKVNSLFEAFHKATYDQENYFFDGANKELSSQRVIARVRFYNTDEKATLTFKGKAIVANGVSRVLEEEHDIEPALGRQILSEPDKLLEVPTDLVEKLKRSYQLQRMVCLGGFKNQRVVYDWQGLTLEVDKTLYDWGTVYEVECETANPEEVRDTLAEFLTSQGVGFKEGVTTKFANFVKRTLD